MLSPVMTRSFLFARAIQEGGLLGHARRKFFDAVKSLSTGIASGAGMDSAVCTTSKIVARTRSPEARRELRVAESIPVLDKIEKLTDRAG